MGSECHADQVSIPPHPIVLASAAKCNRLAFSLRNDLIRLYRLFISLDSFIQLDSAFLILILT